MSSTAGNAPIRPDSPIHVRAPGETSHLLELHACSPPPTYLEAFRLDAARRCIEVDFSRAIAADTEAATSTPAPSPQPAAAAGSGISARALPTSIATGGAQLSGSFSSLHSSLDQAIIRSQARQPHSGAASYLPATERGGRPVVRAGSAYLPEEQRTISLEPIEKENPGVGPPTPYVGHCVHVALRVPNNLDDHSTKITNWVGNYLLVTVGKGREAVKYFLLLDTGSPTDSWVYCNLHWKRLVHFPGFPAKQFTAEHERLYNKKPVIPHPPDHHMLEDNAAELVYGVPESMSKMKIAQTLVKIQFVDGNDIPVVLPELPIGAVIGVSPSDVERGEDGLLAMGRQGAATSSFGSRVRWPSNNLANLLYEQRHISTNTFTIYADHPQFVKQAAACVIFGPFYDPGSPTSMDTDSECWTTIPVLQESGFWEATLHSIMVRIKDRERPYEILVNETVSFDNGSSQTYLPARVVDQIRNQIGPYVSASSFKQKDEVRLIFKLPDEREVEIIGQAKRFFTSPYRTKSGAQSLCFEDSRKALILGLNFFMTFIVSFEDQVRNPRIRVQPHEYAE